MPFTESYVAVLNLVYRYPELIDSGGLFRELWDAQMLKSQRTGAARRAVQEAALPLIESKHGIAG